MNVTVPVGPPELSSDNSGLSGPQPRVAVRVIGAPGVDGVPEVVKLNKTVAG